MIPNAKSSPKCIAKIDKKIYDLINIVHSTGLIPNALYQCIVLFIFSRRQDYTELWNEIRKFVGNF